MFAAMLRPEFFGAALPLDAPPLGDPSLIIDAMTDTVDSDTMYEPVAVGSTAELEVKEGEFVVESTDTDRSVACRVAFEPGRRVARANRGNIQGMWLVCECQCGTGL